MSFPSELELIRASLGMNQTDFGRLLGAKAQSTYQRWEAEPSKPASIRALERAKQIYKDRMHREWLPLKEVPPGTKGAYEPVPPQASDKEGPLSKDQFHAIERSAQWMENLIRSVPPELRERIISTQVGYYVAQMADYLLEGKQEMILEMHAHFLAEIPRQEKKT